MLSRACRFLATATLGVSIASAAVVTLFSILMLAGLLTHPCVATFRQEHGHYDFIMDLVGFPLMSGFFARDVLENDGELSAVDGRRPA
jgi:hypothetical protein